MSGPTAVLAQLRAVRRKWEAQHLVVEDYRVALEKSLELEIRVSQLRKENEEFRDECRDKDQSIARLTQQVNPTCTGHVRIERPQVADAQASIRREYEAVVKEKAELEKEKANVEEDLAKEQESRAAAEERVRELEEEKAKLQTELKEARDAGALAIAEMQTRKAESEKAWGEMRQLEVDNRALMNKIAADQETFAEKWQEVTEMEAMVQKSHREVEALKMRLDLEQQSHQDSNSLFPWRRQQHPFARRLVACARLVDKGDTTKALHVLEMLIIEMQDSRNRCSRLRTQSDAGFILLGEVEENSSWKGAAIAVPMSWQEGCRSHYGGCTSCRGSFNATMVATAGADKEIFLWDPTTLTVQSVLRGMMGGVRDVSFTSDGERVLGAGSDKTVRVWSAVSGQVVHTMTGHGRGVNCVACDPGVAHKAVSCSEDRQICFWDLNTGYMCQGRSIKASERINAVCFSSDGSLVVSGHSKGILKLWDARSSAESCPPETLHGEDTVALCPFPMTSHYVLTGSKDNRLKLFDLRMNETVQCFQDPQFVIGTTSYTGGTKSCLGVSRDEQLIAAGTATGTVMIWNLGAAQSSSPKQLTSPGHQKPVVAVCWANERLFSCDLGGKVLIWT